MYFTKSLPINVYESDISGDPIHRCALAQIFIWGVHIPQRAHLAPLGHFPDLSDLSHLSDLCGSCVFGGLLPIRQGAPPHLSMPSPNNRPDKVETLAPPPSTSPPPPLHPCHSISNPRPSIESLAPSRCSPREHLARPDTLRN